MQVSMHIVWCIPATLQIPRPNLGEMRGVLFGILFERNMSPLYTQTTPKIVLARSLTGAPLYLLGHRACDTPSHLETQ